MKWKEEYKLGDETVDIQHEELFTRVGALIDIVEGEDAVSRIQECINAILFLKDYAVNHFASEEAFQESIGYTFLSIHKEIHNAFVGTVLDAEQRLIDTGFALPEIKKFCGFLSMWLIYHVAGADQKIVENDVISVAELALAVTYEDCVTESLRNVLDTIFGEPPEITKTNKKVIFNNEINFTTEYDETLDIRFTMSMDTALWIVNNITNLNMTEIDELATAALEQFARTICNDAAGQMRKIKDNASDSDAGSGAMPADNNEFYISTKYGKIVISFIQK